MGGTSSPMNPSFILQNNPFYQVSKITLYEIFFVFGLQIPSCYAKGHLWIKLAPDSPLLRVCILNWGQLDKIQQFLSRFCYLKIGHFRLWRSIKIKSRHIESALFVFYFDHKGQRILYTLVARGIHSRSATPKHLQNPNWPSGGPIMADGVWKGVYP